MFTEIEEIKKLNIHQRGKETVVFTEELYVIRILNSLVAFEVSLIFGEDKMIHFEFFPNDQAVFFTLFCPGQSSQFF